MRTKNNLNEQEVVSLFRSADAVCFDVDSTVVKEEGIDELASFCGVGQQVKAWLDNDFLIIFFHFFFCRI